ncbi:Cystathionine beta-lyase [Caenispirillum salinarum AK4]|uniref:Cystathionine beta-lyase n=1 Tax=Caenispirillum salinarum AK4 TaxID=1238182 RepID=K9GUK9_9PROT|nr:cystathionine beta-lyase [Caenispirillum salinarum]EKV28444.1 Cystathionine beta-lyase [Caenispirillum salinarum AK4]
MKEDTRIVHAGRHPARFHGAVNTPVYRCSTILSENVAELKEKVRNKFDMVDYGRLGTPSTMDLEAAVAELEGGARAIATSSGLAAIAGCLTGLLSAGDHLLMTDSAYFPTRKFCDEVLARFGVETTYYDPLIGAGIADLMRDNTKVVFTEAPGSLTFEMQDIPAIAEAAHARGALVAIDNTWATPLFFKPFDHGVDVSIHAGTKYIVGHSDAMVGLIVCKTPELFTRIKSTTSAFGYSLSGDDAFLALRGLRTMKVRLEHHQRAALEIAQWLEARPDVTRVLYPALPSDPGHAIWKRDFTGASGLMGVELAPAGENNITAMNAFLDALKLFGLGFSWGGFESLAIPATGAIQRTATTFRAEGPVVRLHIGLEDIDDLKADLDQAFAAYRAAAG